ncbi:MAG TPA: dihydrodipicolinate synthase family protein [Bryobacteraceae bacterium]|nr:dihydrodipicolinate synthase family protein [Bryobacteraceae bacterium]
MNTESNGEHRAGGLIAAAVTPWRDTDASVDISAAFELIDFLSGQNVSGIALLGSTGEFPHFSLEERARLAAFAVKRSRVSVFVNVSHSTLAGSMQLAEQATQAGAAGLLLMPPYFFRYSEQAVKEFFLRAAENSAQGAPLYLYNLPFFTSAVPPETAVELLGTGGFAGIKDSSGDWEYFQRLRTLRETKPFRLLLGNDRIFTRSQETGADGAVSGVACAMPELMIALQSAIRQGNQAKKTRLEARVQEFIDWTDLLPTPVGIKVAVEARGLKAGALASPLGLDGARTLEQYRGWLSAWIPQVLAEAIDA